MIFETENFVALIKEKPFVDRDEGGTIIIECKLDVKDRTSLTPAQAVEFSFITTLVGEAYTVAMRKQGVDIIRLNYQEMGNWYYKTKTKEHCHVYIFGRVLGAKHQPFPEAVYLPDRSTGFYDDFKPLTNKDKLAIKKEISQLIETDKYKKENWRL